MAGGASNNTTPSRVSGKFTVLRGRRAHGFLRDLAVENERRSRVEEQLRVQRKRLNLKMSISE